MGKGAFATVKLGSHNMTGEKVVSFPFYTLKVAIKIIDKKKDSDPAHLQRIDREVRIMKKMRHPNIVQLFDVINSQLIYF